jgi:deoxyadenosine/deoxycytidine kinase
MVCVEGNIGAGKTTLIKRLKERGLTVSEEPVQEWTNMNGYNFLDLASKDPRNWSFEFQTLAAITVWEKNLMVKSKCKFKNGQCTVC